MNEFPTSDTPPTDESSTGWNLLMLGQMARSIEIAHGANPNCWCVHSWQGEPFTAVGAINIVSVGPTAPYGLLISLEDYHGTDLDSLSGVTVTSRSYSGKPWARYLWLDNETLHHTLGVMQNAHEAAVKRLATSVPGRSLRWKWHESAFVEKARQITGFSFPDPGYINEIPAVAQESASQTVRYWKVDCGGNGASWPTMYQLGRCTHDNWAPDPIFLDELPQDHDAFVAAMIKHPGIQKRAAEHCWKFMNEMSIGDLVVAINSQKAYGWGEVTGSYEYVADNGLGEHQRTVEWAEQLSPHPLINMSQGLRDAIWGIGPRELSSDQFAEAIGDPTVSQGALIEPQNTTGPLSDVRLFESLRASFRASGLHYTSAQITAFYTALQTKGFVVLSGISGTGKSKIATGFVEMLPSPQSEERWLLPQGDDRITLQVRPYIQKHHNFTFPGKYLDRFPGFSTPSSTTVAVRIGDTSGTGNLRYEFRNGHPAVTLWFHKSLYSAIEAQDLDTTLVVDLSYNDDQRVVAIDLAPIVEAGGINNVDSGRTNYLFLAVRPDWRDSTSLLGYYNPLTQTYEWTDFLRFIIRAGENYNGPEEDRIAWFVILDEMNLAHVEYYFADLLSVIESGRDAEGWTGEPLRLTYPDTLDDEAPPRELRLPPNLYIIGTVNMDETTHAFSPKVLDRAFTIELTDVDFRDYPPSGTALDGDGLDDETKASLLRSFSRDGAFARINKGKIAEFVERYPVVRERLQALNDVLRPFRMHFGYRVFDEITQYLANNDVNGMAAFEEAFDQAVFMKVLPKFSGSRARLLSPLHGVLAWAVDPGRTGRDDVEHATKQLLLYERGEAPEAWEMEPTFPRVAERVRDMLVALERDGFVSFG